MSWSDAAAWWGAIVATLVMTWDVYTWAASGPRIRLTGNPDMQLFGGGGAPKDAKYIAVRAANRGDQTTTLTNFTVFHYPNYLARLLRQSDTQGVVTTGGAMSQPLPYPLGPGEVWDGLISQDEEVEEMLRSGYLFVAMYHSVASKPAWVRVQRTKQAQKQPGGEAS